MAMVQLRKEDELPNENEAEEPIQTSEKSEDEGKRSRSSSRNSQSNSKRTSPVFMPQYQYSKDELMKMSKLPLSASRPDCLNQSHNNSTGKWDPEYWFAEKRSTDKPPAAASAASTNTTSTTTTTTTPAVEEPRPKRVRPEPDVPLSHKRRTSDPRERVKEEKDEIILSPQRRSFGTGCHVIQHPNFVKRPGSPADLRDTESFRERRIGSGRIVNRDRDQREWDRDHREYGYGAGRNDRRDRFDQDDGEKDVRRYSNRYTRDRRGRGHDRINEEEPEWFSGGPTSQSETIELIGFEDASNDSENRKGNRKVSKRYKESLHRQTSRPDDESKGETKPASANKPPAKVPHPPADTPSKKCPSPKDPISNGTEERKDSDTKFDIEEFFRYDYWMPGLLENEPPPEESESKEMEGSRLMKWLKTPSGAESLSSSGNIYGAMPKDLIHVIDCIENCESSMLVQSHSSPTCTDPYFAYASPVMKMSPACTIIPPLPSNQDRSRNLLEILQKGGDNNLSTVTGKSDSHNIKEVEANLKRLVLGNNQAQPQQDDTSVFDKLVQNIQSSSTASISMGPLDKSKVLQEEDLLQNILGHSRSTQQISKDKPVFNDKNNSIDSMKPGSLPAQNNIYSKLFESVQHLEAQQQAKLMENQSNNKQNSQGLTVDMLAKILDSHGSLSPTAQTIPPPNMMPFLRNDMHPYNAFMQQRDLMAMMKQQPHQPISQRPITQQPLLHTIKTGHGKDCIIAAPQTLGLPPMAARPSPMQSPLPPEIHGQGRVPSPLVFGQQPPALSHAPAPIHPNHLAPALSQNSVANTLQVQQNPMMLQRVPSPQELAVHTQSILQNALIKRKLEEQKENYRKRQEAHRTTSPNVNQTGNGSSPLKGISPTMAFTPTSVMRKMHSEKTDNLQTKTESLLNGASNVSMGKRTLDMLQRNASNPNAMTSVENLFNNNMRSDVALSQARNGALNATRPNQVQCSMNPRPQQSVGLNCGMSSSQSQGRPIVKVANHQIGPSGEPVRASQMFNKPLMPNNKIFQMTNNQIGEVEANREVMNKLLEQQQRMMQQKQAQMMTHHRQNNSSVHAAASTFNFPPHSGNQNAANLVRPINVGAMNFPYLKTVIPTAPVRAQGLNQLPLGHLATLQQVQRAVTDNRQVLSQGRNFPPMSFQQLLNSQNPGATQPQSASGMIGAHGDGKHTHLLPGQGSTNRQSPVNLTKWFGNDVLKQKMPDMPPVPHQNALSLEEVERQQQTSTAVHN